jgi:hypothetical protein
MEDTDIVGALDQARLQKLALMSPLASLAVQTLRINCATDFRDTMSASCLAKTSLLGGQCSRILDGYDALKQVKFRIELKNSNGIIDELRGTRSVTTADSIGEKAY